MKVLIAHSAYSADNLSGENEVVRAEAALLRDRGHDISLFVPNSDETRGSRASLLSAAMGPIINPKSMRSLRSTLDTFQPDVVHFHNLVPMIGPAAIGMCSARSLPTVATIHNFRMDCANGLHFRSQKGTCTECVGTRNGPAVLHGCYRNSRTQTAAVAIGMNFHAARKTLNEVDKFLVLNSLMRNRLVARGIPKEDIIMRTAWAPVRPNATLIRRKRVLFAGRMDAVKGLDVLLAGWRKARLFDSGWELVVAGSGPMAGVVERLAPENVTYLGRLSHDDVLHMLQESAVCAVPSTLLEGYPLVIAEALAGGAFVLASSSLACSSSLDPSCTAIVQPTAGAWGAALDALRDIDFATVPEEALRVFRDRHSPVAAVVQLEQTYEAAMESKQLRGI